MESARNAPLVVDLDGTLTPVDTLAESLIRAIRKAPAVLLLLPLWLLRGRAAFKRAVAQRARAAVAHLPYREPLLAWLRDEKAAGRRLVLATAADRTIADEVARHLGLFDAVLATEDGHNLKGEAKLAAIRAEVGPVFAYAGDSRADLPVWLGAQAAVLVGVTDTVAAQVRGRVPIEREFPAEPAGLRAWMRALRLHQWLKNLLVFVPLLTAFAFADAGVLARAFGAFLAFSLAASATYVVNDLWDLDSDRMHPRKRFRPLAAGQLPIVRALAVAAAALMVALALAAWVGAAFLLMLVVYLVLTSAYSSVLKQYVLIDVLTLALLYTLRIVAGAAATGIAVSSWLAAFSVFVFLSLALVKRCAELVSLREAGVPATRGRDYRVGDLVVLWPLGVGAALSSVVIFGLFISAPQTVERYATPEALWLAAVGLIYWLSRLWIKTSRGEMHDDPVVYAMRDRGSRVAVFGMIVVALAARFVVLGAP
jgi:4-hydroxybenzoate polyprenyltransferase/phosphoserine phosphatase